MRSLIIIFCLVVAGTGLSQEWKRIPAQDIFGINIGMPPAQMSVHPETNHIWFSGYTRMFTYGEGIAEYLKYSDFGAPTVDYFDFVDSTVWMISNHANVTGALYSYDGSIMNHEANLGVMAYTIKKDNQDTLWIGSNNWDGIGVHAFSDGNYNFYNSSNSVVGRNSF